MSIHQNSWQLADILAIYESLPLDIMLIEGYKMNIIRRLSLRTAQDQVLLQQVTNILCVIFWPSCPRSIPFIPAFSIYEESQYMEFLLTEMRENYDDSVI